MKTIITIEHPSDLDTAREIKELTKKVYLASMYRKYELSGQLVKNIIDMSTSISAETVLEAERE